jgi:hypothetical protein
VQPPLLNKFARPQRQRNNFTDENVEGSDDSEIDDDELDDELGLPDILVNISIKEKRELLKFKKSHNDVRRMEVILLHTIPVPDSYSYFIPKIV